MRTWRGHDSKGKRRTVRRHHPLLVRLRDPEPRALSRESRALHAASRRAIERAAFLAEAGRVLASSLDIEDTLQTVTRLMLARLSDWCVIHGVGENGMPVRLAGAKRLPAMEAAAPVERNYREWAGSPLNEVLRSGCPYFFPAIAKGYVEATVPDEEQRAIWHRIHPRSLMVVPLRARGHIVGALTMVRTAPEAPLYNEDDLTLAQELADRAALAVENAQLYAEAKAAQASAREAARRSAFLAEASALLASSLDYEATLDVVANLALPTLGDCCAVHLLGEAGAPRALTVAHVGEAALAREHAIEELYAGNSPVAEALRSGRPLLISQAPSDWKSPLSAGGLGVRSVMVVPLSARQRTFGALSFLVGSHSERRYTPADLALARDLADRAALAVDNARLFHSANDAMDAALEARRIAEDASRMKDEFLATVSHELRTPLTSMLGWTQLLRDSGLSEATRRRGLDSIERNARGQAKLIEDLLDVSRIIRGSLRLSVREVELTELVGAVVDSLRPAADARRLHLDCVLGQAQAIVKGDPDRLQQIIWNLLSNALKFTPEGGRVRASVLAREDRIEIEIADTGHGMGPDLLPHIFDPFRQGEAGAQAQGGLGLGLAIVHRLVELHGGSVRASSAGEGRGSTFTVVLPRAIAASSGG